MPEDNHIITCHKHIGWKLICCLWVKKIEKQKNLKQCTCICCICSDKDEIFNDVHSSELQKKGYVEKKLEHYMWDMKQGIYVLLSFLEYDSWPNHWESFLLRSRPEPRERICLHLSRWNHQTMDVSWFPRRERVRKCQYYLLQLFFVPTHSCRDAFDELVAVKMASWVFFGIVL